MEAYMKNIKPFIFSYISVLLVISNILVFKTINFLDLPLSASILTYPIIFAFILIIAQKYGRERAMKTVVQACIIQLIIAIVCKFSIWLPTYPGTENTANLLKDLFNTKSYIIISSMACFLLCQALSIHLYFKLKLIANKCLAFSLSMFLTLLIDTIVFTLVTNVEAFNELKTTLFVINKISIQGIFGFVITIFSTIMFYYCVYDKKKKEEEPRTIKKGGKTKTK